MFYTSYSLSYFLTKSLDRKSQKVENLMVCEGKKKKKMYRRHQGIYAFLFSYNDMFNEIQRKFTIG